MAHVKAHPQPGIVHALHDGRQHVRAVVHDVFQGDGHILRHLRQEAPPEGDRLLHEPLGKVDEGHISVVDDDALHVQAAGHGNGLAVAPRRDLPHQRVDGAGVQLGNGGVEPQAVKVRRLCFCGGCGGAVLQGGRHAEGGDLEAQAVSAGQGRSGTVDAGQMEFFAQWGAVHGQHLFSDSIACSQEKRKRYVLAYRFLSLIHRRRRTRRPHPHPGRRYRPSRSRRRPVRHRRSSRSWGIPR